MAMAVYRPGDLVWGKMKGSPPWPAKVLVESEVPMMKPRAGCLPVRFFGTQQTAMLKSASELYAYGHFRQLFEVSRPKLRHFNRAVQEIRKEAGIDEDEGQLNALFPIASVAKKEVGEREKKVAMKTPSKNDHRKSISPPTMDVTEDDLPLVTTSRGRSIRPNAHLSKDFYLEGRMQLKAVIARPPSITKRLLAEVDEGEEDGGNSPPPLKRRKDEATEMNAAIDMPLPTPLVDEAAIESRRSTHRLYRPKPRETNVLLRNAAGGGEDSRGKQRKTIDPIISGGDLIGKSNDKAKEENVKTPLAEELKKLEKEVATVRQVEKNFTEQLNNARNDVEVAFTKAENLLKQRKGRLLAELDRCKDNGQQLLTVRSVQCQHLKDAADHLTAMNEREVGKLRLDIHALVAERVYEEQLNGANRFQVTVTPMLDMIKDFGEVIPVKQEVD